MTEPAIREDLRDRTSWQLPLLLPGLALLAIFAFRQVSSIDIGFHLKAGNYILNNHAWPRTDPFTYTVRDHPYFDTSWGYQVLVALAERIAGPAGIVILHEMLLLSAFLVVWRTILRLGGDARIAGALLIAAVIACEMRYEARPEILSILLLAIVLNILHRQTEGLRPALWPLPVIFLVWANCHSFFVLGWASIAAFIIGGSLETRRLDARLARWGLLSVAVCLLNPYGFQGVLFPFFLLTRFDHSNVFSETIGELRSPFFVGLGGGASPFYPHWSIWTFRILAIASIGSVMQLIRMRRFTHALIWLLFFFAAARMLRNMSLFAIAALPGMIIAFSGLRDQPIHRTGRRAGPSIAFAVSTLLAISLGVRTITNAHYLDDRRDQRFGCSWNAIELPVDASKYANRVGLHGPMFNHINVGAYWMWAQNDPVFIDGRLEVIGEDFYSKYLDILSKPEAFASADQEHHFNYVIIPYAFSPEFLVRMFNNPAWRLAWFDHHSAIFVRRTPDFDHWIDPEIDRIVRPAPTDLSRLPGFNGNAREVGLWHWLLGLRQSADIRTAYALGIFHLFHGDLELAESLFADVIARSNGAYYEAYRSLGAVLWKLNRKDDAKTCYRIVLEDAPDDRLARQRLYE